jgi:hypothetical protein
MSKEKLLELIQCYKELDMRLSVLLDDILKRKKITKNKENQN